MSKNPLVSVIIPTYNRAELVCQTIDNVFQQTYSNFELIVVDDGSTDDTQSRLRQYGNRIRVVTQDNAGPAVARNRGVEVAHGEIIAFQDSDDLWKPSKLRRQVSLLEKAGRSVPCCLSNVLMRVVEGKEFTSFGTSLIVPRYEEGIWLNVQEVLATRFVLFNQAVAIWRESFEKTGGFDENLKYLEDYDLPLRLALEGPWAIIREPLVIYREGTEGSFSGQALRAALVLKECELTIFGRALTSVRKRGGNRRLERYLKHRIADFHVGLYAVQLRQSRSSIARLTGEFLKELNHHYHSAFRRSPWFPKAITVPVGAAGS